MSTQLRAKRFLIRQGQPLALILVALGLVAIAAGGYVYTTPPTETITETVDVQTVSAELGHSAVVTGETRIFAQGERLVDSSAYLFGATPVVLLNASTTVPSGTEVIVDQRMTVELSATNNGEEFWSDRTLLAVERQQVTDGDARFSASLNVTDLRRRVDDTRDELGGVGILHTRLNLTVDYDTGLHQGRLTVTTPVVLAGNAYWFDQELSTSQEHSRTVTRTVEAEPDLLTVGVLELFGLVSLGAAAAIVLIQRGGADLEELDTALAHERYEEWISEGEFPTRTDKKYVHINSLEDLVDVAIDSNKRVLHDLDLETYAVVDGDLIYYHTLDRSAVDSWLDI